MPFQKDFVWGAATASYQIEGGWDADGKGLSVWDVYSHQPGNVKNDDTGDVACDHYHRFKDDVKLMKELGIRAYRFSLSWPRLIPEGEGELNPAGVKFYSDLIDALLENGITPYITLFHWDYPYALYQRGGWLNSDSVRWFAEYAEKVTELFSDRVEYFITFNEPQCFIGQGYYQGLHAPGLKVSRKDILQMAHNVMKAHGAAVIAMRKAAKRPVKIGYAPTGSAFYPATNAPEDVAAARALYFASQKPNAGDLMWSVSWWSDPVILGKYPEDGLAMYKDFLPEITPEDMELIHQPLDFYGQNIYTGRAVSGAGGEPVILPRKVGCPKTAIQWYIAPEALQWGPKFLYERYGLPIYITENGMSAHDVVSLDGKVHDPNRIDFTHRYLLELEKAVDAGVPVEGYFHWSFMDNFEWGHGYNERFGLVYVDYETQQRIPKDSALWYREWIKQHE